MLVLPDFEIEVSRELVWQEMSRMRRSKEDVIRDIVRARIDDIQRKRKSNGEPHALFGVVIKLV